MPQPRRSATVKAISGSREPTLPTLSPLAPLEAPPEPPDWLPNAHALKEWKRLAPILVLNKRLTEAGLSALGMLCSMHGQIVQTYAAGQSPTASLMTQYRNLLGDFGVTGAAAGAGAGQTPPTNPFAKHGRRPS